MEKNNVLFIITLIGIVLFLIGGFAVQRGWITL